MSNTFKDRTKIKRGRHGVRRRSNDATKKIAELQAKKDIQKEEDAKRKRELLKKYNSN
jgi:hypothetical protein